MNIIRARRVCSYMCEPSELTEPCERSHVLCFVISRVASMSMSLVYSSTVLYQNEIRDKCGIDDSLAWIVHETLHTRFMLAKAVDLFSPFYTKIFTQKYTKPARSKKSDALMDIQSKIKSNSSPSF